MPIKFYNGGPRKQKIEVLSIPPTREVRFMGDQSHSVVVMLHWVNGRSLPCMDGECTICPKRSFPYGYAPVLALGLDTRNRVVYVPRILPITERVLELAQQDMRNKKVKVFRHPNTVHGKMYYEVVADLEPETFKPFDVLDCMKAIWSQNKAGVRPGEERDGDNQKLLPFPEVG